MIALIAAVLLGTQAPDQLASDVQKSVSMAHAYAVVVGYRLCAAPDLKQKADALHARLVAAGTTLTRKFGAGAVQTSAPPVIVGAASICDNRKAAITAPEGFEQAVTTLESIAAGSGS